MAQNDDYIIEILLETSLITKSQLERARTERQGEETVVDALIRQGVVAQEDVTPGARGARRHGLCGFDGAFRQR